MVGETSINPHDDNEARCIHTACPPQVEEDVPNPPENAPRRSTRISELTRNSSEKNSSAYMQAIDTMPEGYIHFSFNNDEWCNLGNKDDPISYRDAFSRPDVSFWQAVYEDKMKSLHDHKVWDLIPHDQVPPS